MTGFLKYYKNDDDEPDHARLLIQFANGYKLAYDNQRKLGSVSITEAVDKFVEQNDLGPDALKLKQAEFEEIMLSKKGSVKSALMKQESMAGIGNVYSDEILFQAGYHPKTRVDDLDSSDLKKIYKNMRKVLKTAIEKKADPKKMPRNYLLRQREDGAKCPKRDNGRIEKKKISGRPSYYCKKHQKRS